MEGRWTLLIEFSLSLSPRDDMKRDEMTRLDDTFYSSPSTAECNVMSVAASDEMGETGARGTCLRRWHTHTGSTRCVLQQHTAQESKAASQEPSGMITIPKRLQTCTLTAVYWSGD